MKEEISKYKVAIITAMLRAAKEKFGDKYLTFVVPTYCAKSFQSYCSMKEDFKLIEKYLNLLEAGGLDKTITSSLMYSTISLYGKCFMDASESKAPKLEPNDLFKDDKIHKSHEFMMELRHRFISHRGETDSEIESTFYLMEKSGSKTRVEFMRIKQTSFKKKEIEQIRELIIHINKALDKKIEKTSKKIQKHLLSLDPEILAMLNINNMKEK